MLTATKDNRAAIIVGRIIQMRLRHSALPMARTSMSPVAAATGAVRRSTKIGSYFAAGGVASATGGRGASFGARENIDAIRFETAMTSRNKTGLPAARLQTIKVATRLMRALLRSMILSENRFPL